MHHVLQNAVKSSLSMHLMSAALTARPQSHRAGRGCAGRMPDHHKRRHLGAAVAGPGGAAAHRRLQVRLALPCYMCNGCLRPFPRSPLLALRWNMTRGEAWPTMSIFCWPQMRAAADGAGLHPGADLHIGPLVCRHTAAMLPSASHLPCVWQQKPVHACTQSARSERWRLSLSAPCSRNCVLPSHAAGMLPSATPPSWRWWVHGKRPAGHPGPSGCTCVVIKYHACVMMKFCICQHAGTAEQLTV
jgi:hypothetical protein